MLTLALFLCITGCAHTPPSAESSSTSIDPLSAALRDMCSSDVALVGEGAGHADGRALAVKGELVQRLVEECGFGAVVFEASSYDFLEIDRRLLDGRPVTREMVSSAVGGLWNRNEELQPMITWMHAALIANGLRLGGMDDQLGSAGAFYSINEMPAELSGLLTHDRAECRELLRQLIYGELGSSPVEQGPLAACLSRLRAAVDAMPQSDDRETHFQNLANMDRYVSRMGSDTAAYIQGRSRSMWLNYQWWTDRRFPRGTRVIVWGATVHLSRDATAHPPFATLSNFGSSVAEAHGHRAFFLGFSAASGAYMSGGEARSRPQAAPGSLEAVALAGPDLDQVYLDGPALHRLGTLPGAVFSADPVAARWSAVVDGVIVFREERPPTRTTRR